MKAYESLGFVIGAFFGAVSTGVCVYFTQSPFSSFLGVVGTLFGGWIGRSIPRKK